MTTRPAAPSTPPWRRRRLRIVAVALAALTALALPATALGASTGPVNAAAPSRSAASPVTFTVGILNNVDSFNPFLGIEAESYEMWALMYDYMINYNMTDMSPRPGLATSWDTSDNGLTWTFHIRTGVKWSDGKPLTAADIAYTYNRIMHGTTESSSWGSYLKSVQTVTAPNPTTVVLKLKKPNAVLPLLPMPIIPKHIWDHISEKQVKTYSNEPPNVVGSGPFRIVSGSASGSVYIFKANPTYWQGRPHIDRLIFRVYNAEDTLVQALKKGEVDFAEGISSLQVKALQGQPNIAAQNGDSPGFDEIAFNTGSVDLKTGKPKGNPNPAVLDPKFRFALNFAIDRQAIVQRVYQGGGKPATTIIPPAYKQYQWKAPQGAFAYDPKKAARLLTAAGYKLNSSGQRTMPDGSPMQPLRLFARSESPTSLGTMNFFQGYLKDLGIPSKITSMESGKLTNTILTGDYDTFQWGWYVEPDPDSMLSYFTCGQRGNWSDSWWCNKTYDKLYTEQHDSTNQTQREAIVKRMQRMLYYAAPYLNTAYSSIGEAYRTDRFHCFVPQPNPGGILLFQYGVNNYIHIEPTGTPCQTWWGSTQDASQGGGNGSGGGSTPAASGSTDSGSGSTVLIIVVIAVVIGVGGLLGGFAFYRRATTDNRE